MLDTDGKENNPLKSLKQFLQSNTPLLLVIGEGGSDKTHLLGELVADIQVDRRVIRLQGEHHLQPAQLTTLLSHHWDLNINLSDTSYRHQLDEIITDLTDKHQACVLIVENAHCLPISTLAALSHLTIKQDDSTVYLHVLLLGESELLNKVSSLQTKTIPYIQTSRPSQEKASQPPPPEKPKKEATSRVNPWKQHAVKAASITALLIIGLALWYHKKSDTPSIKHQPIATKSHPAAPPPVAVKQATPHIQAPIKATVPVPPTMPTSEPIQKPIAVKPPASPHHNHIYVTSTANNSTSFTLQLMGSHSIIKLNKFIIDNHLEKTTQVSVSKLGGKNWYIVTYGHYSSKQQAEQARQQLMADIKGVHPWARQLQHQNRP